MPETGLPRISLVGNSVNSANPRRITRRKLSFHKVCQGVYEREEIKLQGKEISFGCVKRNIPGRHPALHPALALPVPKWQARVGNLRRALGTDGTQPRSDALGGQLC